jgi:hypothetical protein
MQNKQHACDNVQHTHGVLLLLLQSPLVLLLVQEPQHARISVRLRAVVCPLTQRRQPQLLHGCFVAAAVLLLLLLLVQQGDPGRLNPHKHTNLHDMESSDRYGCQ